jgi:hypothetical protein
MKKLLVITATIEAGTGIGLLAAPSAVAGLLLGAMLDVPAAVTIARVGGAGLLTIGIACWLARNNGRALVVAMLFYNIAAVAILAYAASGSRSPASASGRPLACTPRWRPGAQPLSSPQPWFDKTWRPGEVELVK